MKTTLFFKRADFFIQLTALLLPIVAGLYYGNPGYLICCFIFLGFAQPVSCLFNVFLLDEFIKQPGRCLYEKALIGIIVTGLFAIAVDGLLTRVLSVMILSVSPFMAVLYFVISYREIRFIAMQVDRKQYV